VIDRLLKDYQKVLEHMVAHPQRPISKIPVSARMKPSRT
jgi:hypothetical protein